MQLHRLDGSDQNDITQMAASLHFVAPAQQPDFRGGSGLHRQAFQEPGGGSCQFPKAWAQKLAQHHIFNILLVRAIAEPAQTQGDTAQTHLLMGGESAAFLNLPHAPHQRSLL